MHWNVLTILLAAVAADPLPKRQIEAIYLGNEGVLVTQGETKVLFDAFFSESYNGQYTLVPTMMEPALLAGHAPFDGIDAVFVSHGHADHFDAGKATSFLKANPGARLYADAGVVAAIARRSGEAVRQQLVAVAPTPDAPANFALPGLGIEAFAIPHDGNLPLPHNVFRVTFAGLASVMHFGDAGGDEAFLRPYRTALGSRVTDAAFVPTWLIGEGAGKSIWETVAPGMIIAVHVEDRRRASAPGFRSELGADAFVEPGEKRAIRGKSR